VGALIAYLAAEATAALKRKGLIFGLLAIGGLISIFAVGYALDAGHRVLMFRYGSVAASLIVAGGLLALAIGCHVAAKVIARRPRMVEAKKLASPYLVAPHPAPYSKERLIAVAAGLAGAATAIAALIKFKRLRTLLRGRSGIGDCP
jgi:hypothetical protein